MRGAPAAGQGSRFARKSHSKPVNCAARANHHYRSGEIDENRCNPLHSVQTKSSYGRPRRQKSGPERG